MDNNGVRNDVGQERAVSIQVNIIMEQKYSYFHAVVIGDDRGIYCQIIGSYYVPYNDLR